MKAPGKVILFGEHAVVYGKSGIAAPVNDLFTEVKIEPCPALSVSYDRVFNEEDKQKVELLIEFIVKKLKIKSNVKINIKSTLPISAGLGSSASLSVSLIRSLSYFFKLNIDNKKINKIAFECEKIFHGTPSGIDNTVVTYEKPVFFKEVLQVKNPISIVIANSGVRASTKEVVIGVRERYFQNKDEYSKTFEEINQITIKAKECIESGKLKQLGILMTKNHELLKKIEVSSAKLDLLCEVAMANGAYGAKLAGAGKGGNMITLVDEQNKDKVINELIPLSKWVYYTKIS